jgi:hypothetical protein
MSLCYDRLNNNLNMTGPRVYASKADYYADMLDRLVRDLSESVEQKVWESLDLF